MVYDICCDLDYFITYFCKRFELIYDIIEPLYNDIKLFYDTQFIDNNLTKINKYYCLFISFYYYWHRNNDNIMVKYLNRGIKHRIYDCWFLLGEYYSDLNKIPSAKKYYLLYNNNNVSNIYKITAKINLYYLYKINYYKYL